MEKRITKRDNLNEVLIIAKELGREDLIDFASHEIELLDRRAANKTLTKTQKENIELAEIVYNVIASFDEPVTIAQIQEADNETVKEFSNQKLTSLVKKLVDAERVVKYTEKNKTFYSIAE